MKLTKAIIRLWNIVLVQSHLGEDNQIVGKSIIVGIRIFSIVGDLGPVIGLFRGFGLWRPVGQDLHWPRRLRRPVGE